MINFKLFLEESSPNVRIIGYSSDGIVDVIIDGKQYEYHVTDYAEGLYNRAKQLARFTPGKAINFLKANSSKVVRK